MHVMKCIIGYLEVVSKNPIEKVPKKGEFNNSNQGFGQKPIYSCLGN